MVEHITIGRAAAKSSGLTRYRTGKLCPHGHVCERLTCNACCVECMKARKMPTETRRRRRKAWQLAHPERFREIKKAWRQANLGSRAAIQHAYRTRRLGAEGSYTQEDLCKLLSQQQGECLCGADFSLVGYTVDHKTPLSRGGTNWSSNIQLLCSICNSSKGAKLMCEWSAPNRRAA